MRRLLALAATAFVLSGCAASAAESGGHDGPVSPPPTMEQTKPATLTIVTTYDIPDGAPIFIEGAVEQIILRDANGHRIARKTAMPGKRIVFKNVKPGKYTLAGGIRPCDGNCDYLDPPLDTCSKTIRVRSDLVLKAAFTVGEPCTIAFAGND